MEMVHFVSTLPMTRAEGAYERCREKFEINIVALGGERGEENP